MAFGRAYRTIRYPGRVDRERAFRVGTPADRDLVAARQLAVALVYGLDSFIDGFFFAD